MQPLPPPTAPAERGEGGREGGGERGREGGREREERERGGGEGGREGETCNVLTLSVWVWLT